MEGQACAVAEAVKCGRSAFGGHTGLVGAAATEEVPKHCFLQTRPAATCLSGAVRTPTPYFIPLANSMGWVTVTNRVLPEKVPRISQSHCL